MRSWILSFALVLAAAAAATGVSNYGTFTADSITAPTITATTTLTTVDLVATGTTTGVVAPTYIDGLAIVVTSITTMGWEVHDGGAAATTTGTLMAVSSTLIGDISTNGANGLDTGSAAASTIYLVFVIEDSTGVESQATLASLSSPPLLPSGYDLYRRVGTVRMGATYLACQTMTDGMCRYNVLVQVVSGGTATAATEVSLATLVPATAREWYCWFYLVTTGNYTGMVGALANTTALQLTINTTQSTASGPVPIVTTQKTYYKVTNAGATAYIAVMGYADDRSQP